VSALRALQLLGAPAGIGMLSFCSSALMTFANSSNGLAPDRNFPLTKKDGVDSTPMSLFIGKDGKLVERLVGAPDDVREIEAGLERRVTWLLGS